MALDFGILANVGDTIKGAGGVVEDTIGAVGGVIVEDDSLVVYPDAREALSGTMQVSGATEGVALLHIDKAEEVWYVWAVQFGRLLVVLRVGASFRYNEEPLRRGWTCLKVLPRCPS